MDYPAKADGRMKTVLEKFKDELVSVRTGRANPQMLDGIKVEYYGQLVPLKQVAAVSVPEARTLEIRPWDPALLAEIEKALKKSDLGLPPQNDSKSIRLNMPAMTEERRKDLVKLVGKLGEECRVGVRNERRDVLEELKKEAKDSKMPEDKQKTVEAAVQKVTDLYVKKVDEAVAEKQKEITVI